MTFRETIEKIREFGNVQVDCDFFVIRSSFVWISTNEEYIQGAIERGVNPKSCQNCLKRKENAEHVLKTLQEDQEKIEPPFSPLKRFASIYPLS